VETLVDFYEIWDAADSAFLNVFVSRQVHRNGKTKNIGIVMLTLPEDWRAERLHKKISYNRRLWIPS
jgi:hypothetical protein